MADSNLLEDTRVVTQNVEPGDHDTFSHYVRVKDLERAIFEGVEIKALCGKMWLPTKDHSRFPTCPTCKEIWEGFQSE